MLTIPDIVVSMSLVKPALSPTYQEKIGTLKSTDTVNLGLQQLKYPASIPPKPRSIKKHTSLTPQF